MHANNMRTRADWDSQRRAIVQALLAMAKRDDWSGWDPYDGLMIQSGPVSYLRRFRFTRLILIQSLRRSPVNPRKLLGVPKLRNPKALALGVEAAWRLGKACRVFREELSECVRLIDELVGMATPTGSGHGWGYPFDWQARAFWIPRDTPTSVCTGFVVRALDRARREIDLPPETRRAVEQSIARASEFVLNDLNVTRDEHGFCWSYSPLDRAAVVNASLLAAETVMRAGAAQQDRTAPDRVKETIEWCFARQASDGGWAYGEAKHHRWEDSFHTGFNIASLRAIRVAAEELGREPENLVPVDRLHRAYEYYARAFFDPDGRPWYYRHTPWPIDPHAAAVGVLTHLDFAEEYPGAAERAEKILRWTIEHMWLEKEGWFAFRKLRWGRIDIPYLRWVQAWMLLALAEFESHLQRAQSTGHRTVD